MAMMTRIFMSFHHICFLTRFAPRRNPWAEAARLSERREQLLSLSLRTSLVLEIVEPFTALCNLRDVLVHDVDSGVNLRLDIGDLNQVSRSTQMQRLPTF